MKNKEPITPKRAAGLLLRLCLLLLLGGLWVWFFLPVPIYGVVNIGNAAGMAAAAAGWFAVLFWGKLRPLLRRWWGKRPGKIALSCFLSLLLAGVLTVGALGVHMVKGAVNRPRGNETVLVLGCQVNGTSPSLMLSRRIAAAKEYLEAHPDAVCVLSGGQGSDEGISEAECMFRALTAAGIDPARLYKEERSTSTRENLAFSLALIREQGLAEEIAIVTDGFHQYRAAFLAKEYPRAAAIPAKTPVVLLPTYVVRECFAILNDRFLR